MPSDRVFADRYRLLEPLGSGGMSVVWRAHDDVLDRPVAVKLISDSVDPRCRPQLRAEARAAARLHHPGIAEVFDYGEAAQDADDGAAAVPYLVMELVDGTPLSSRLAGHAALSWRQAAAVCAVLADALDEVHGLGLVHRDIKPANVLLTGRGAKLVDFGICARVGAADAQDGQLLGTPAYVSPERIADTPVEPASDVYALGMLFYRMVAGVLPWPVDSTTGLLQAHLYTDPTPVGDVTDAPVDLAALVMCCLDKEPASRPSAADLAEAFSRHAAAGGPDPVGEADPVSPPDLPPDLQPVLTPDLQPAPTSDLPPVPTSDLPPVLTPDAATAPVGSGRWRAHATIAVLGAVRPVPQHAGPRRRLVGVAAGIVLLALLGLLWSSQDRSEGASASGAGGAGLAASPACTATFVVRTDTGTGFDATVTVTDPAGRVGGWDVAFQFPGGQTLRQPGTQQAQLSSGSGSTQPATLSLTQTGTRVRASTSGAPLAGSLTFAVSASYHQANPLPTTVTLGGRPCSTQVAGAVGTPAPVASPTTVSKGGGDDGPGPGKGGPGKPKGKGKP